MITELLLTGLFGIADLFFGLLPDLEWTMNTGAWGAAADVLSMVCYLLPLNHIIGVITFILTIAGVRLMIAFIKFILQLLPFI